MIYEITKFNYDICKIIFDYQEHVFVYNVIVSSGSRNSMFDNEITDVWPYINIEDAQNKYEIVAKEHFNECGNILNINNLIEKCDLTNNNYKFWICNCHVFRVTLHKTSPGDNFCI